MHEFRISFRASVHHKRTEPADGPAHSQANSTSTLPETGYATPWCFWHERPRKIFISIICLCLCFAAVLTTGTPESGAQTRTTQLRSSKFLSRPLEIELSFPFPGLSQFHPRQAKFCGTVQALEMLCSQKANKSNTLGYIQPGFFFSASLFFVSGRRWWTVVGLGCALLVALIAASATTTVLCKENWPFRLEIYSPQTCGFLTGSNVVCEDNVSQLWRTWAPSTRRLRSFIPLSFVEFSILCHNVVRNALMPTAHVSSESHVLFGTVKKSPLWELDEYSQGLHRSRTFWQLPVTNFEKSHLCIMQGIRTYRMLRSINKCCAFTQRMKQNIILWFYQN